MEIEKRKDENCQQYLWRVGSLKDAGVITQTWEELSPVLNEQTGITKRADVYRKEYAIAKKYLENVFLLPSVKTDSEIRAEVYKKQAQSKNAETNKWLREHARDELILEEIKEAVKQLINPWTYQNIGYVVSYEEQYEIVADIIDKLISHNILFEVAKKMEEGQTFFEKFISNLKQINISYDNIVTSVKEASSWIWGWEHTDEGLNYGLSKCLPEFRKEFFKSSYDIFNNLNTKIMQIWAADGEEAQRKSIDDYNAYLNSL